MLTEISEMDEGANTRVAVELVPLETPEALFEELLTVGAVGEPPPDVVLGYHN